MTKSITHIAPFQIEEFGLLEQSPPYLQIGIVQGATIDAFTLDAGAYFTFLNGAGEIEQITYNSFLQTFVDYLAFAGFGTWTYSYDFDTCTLTLDGGVNVAAFTFDATSRLILGMESSSTQKSLYTNTVQPWYIWKSTEADWQALSYPYEAMTVVREKECDDGRVYQSSNEDNLSWLSNKSLNITYLDWEHHWEPRENIYNNYSSSINSYTYQQHLLHIRSGKPFTVFQGCTGSSTLYSDRKGTYKIRADKSAFKPVVSNKNLESYWNISLETRQLSLGTNFGTYNATTANELFEPTSINNCILWLDASAGIELFGSTVKTWYDQSGQSNHLTQSNAVKMPLYVSSETTLNNKPTLQFDGINSLMSSIATINFNTASSATVFSVWEETGVATNNKQVIWTQLSTSQNTIQVATSGSYLYNTYKSGSSNPAIFTSSNVSIAQNTPYLESFVFQTYNSGSHFSGSKYLNNVFITGSVFGNTSMAAGTISNTQIHLVGAGSTGGASLFKGFIPEIIVYNRELLDSEITQVNNYLSEKYGL